MKPFDVFALAIPLMKTAQEAGRAIMDVYEREFSIETKLDNSPVTEADQLAEDIILASLHRLAPSIPVIAEEAASAGNIPEISECFFLVDPLDGTKEFINKNGEFTVNIALINHGVPVFGVIYAPAISLFFATIGPDHAIRFKLGINDQFPVADQQKFTTIRTRSPASDGLRVIASRSHMNEETRAYLKDLTVSSMVNAGSSLKFCRLAEGAADLYPRFAPTMEWDTAAGHAILVAAGGSVTTTDGQPFRYGKSRSNYLNSSFIARARPDTGAKTSAAVHSKLDALIAHLHTVVSKQAIPSEPADQIQHSDQFSVYLIWLGNEPLLPQRTYVFNQQDVETTCSITALKYRLNTANDEHLAANTLDKFEVGNCNVELDNPINYKAAQHDKVLGKFSLKDKQTGEEVAVGLIHFGLRRATNIRWQTLEINKYERALAKKQKPHVIWFTGLSGSGKSTIASLLEKKLHSMGRHTYVMDGDNVRHGLCRDLGFTDADRVENIRRIAETARLFVDAGLIVLVSFISPFNSERRMARDLFEAGEFREIFVDTPLEICEQRDPKGLYRKARMGEIKNFTGLDSPYEKPENADIVLSGGVETPEQQVNRILRYLDQNKLI